MHIKPFFSLGRKGWPRSELAPMTNVRYNSLFWMCTLNPFSSSISSDGSIFMAIPLILHLTILGVCIFSLQHFRNSNITTHTTTIRGLRPEYLLPLSDPIVLNKRYVIIYIYIYMCVCVYICIYIYAGPSEAGGAGGASAPPIIWPSWVYVIPQMSICSLL